MTEPQTNVTSQPGPLISVLMPVYNAEAFLREALDSILAQTYKAWELICVDDGSSDTSLRVLREYADRDARVRVISRPNTGIVGALNDALDAAGGEYIARMDADDWCDPRRFALQVDYLESHPDCVALGTYVQRTDPHGSPAGTQEPPLDHATIDAGLLAGDASVLVHASLMMRADTLRAVGGWRDGTDWVEDLDLCLRLTERGQTANLPEYLYSYRRHAGSVCFNRYEQMCQKLKQVLREAYERRGILGSFQEEAIRPDLAPKQSASEHYRNWACYALHAKNRPLARKHASSALKLAPLSPKSWKVAYWAYAEPHVRKFMTTESLKYAYWALLNKWNRRRNPVSTDYSPHPFLEGIDRNLPGGHTSLVMVDGGAHDGQMALRFAQRFPNLEVHAFEPNADLFPRLKANLAGVPGGRHPQALASRSQTLEMFINDSPMTSSVLARNENSERYFDAVTQVKEVRELEATSLDDWFDQSGLDRVDIIKLDLQGFELEALRGARRVLQRGVACVYLEVNYVPFYEGSCTFGEIDVYMRSLGYKLFNLYNTCTHQPEGAIGSGDALYIPDPAAAQAVLKEAA